MNILINAYNLRIGGGESVGLGVVKSLYAVEPKHLFHVLVPNNEAYQKFESSAVVTIHRVPAFFTRYRIGRLMNSLYLIYVTSTLNPDAVFSMGNYAIPCQKKQLLLLHWPYAVYPDSVVWDQMSFADAIKRKIRRTVVKLKLRYTSALTVQTELMKSRVQKHLHYTKPIHVIESASALSIPQGNKNKQALERLAAERTLFPNHTFLLFVSVYYSHKNMEVLIPLAKKIKEANDRFKIFISLAPGQDKNGDLLLQKIKKETLEDVIINLGHIPRHELLGVYKSSDAFLMPTFLESYGITYVEAMSAEIPIFTSDLDFAHETCGEAAFYFDPSDYLSIYSTLKNAYSSPQNIAHKIALGKEKANCVLSWERITLKYIRTLENL